MISNKASLVTRLGWVIKDIEQLITQARNAFDNYIQDENAKHSEDDSQTALQESSGLIEQVQGTLDLVNADGAVMLAREMNLLIKALHNKETSKVEEAKHALVDAFIRLPDYLKHLQEAYADLPVIILPLLNDLRAAREAELLSEHLVFLPDGDVINNDDIGTSEYIPLSAEHLQKACVRLRYHFQKSLLGWYQDNDRQKSLQTLQRVSKNLIRLNESIRLRSLWWIVTALAEALEKEKLDSSVTIKLLMGRIEREIRQFGELQEAQYKQTLPDELIKNLLYYVGLAGKGGETLDAVKSAYMLDLYLPQGETLEELREYYNAPGREMWKAVADSLNENIVLISRNIEAIDKAESASVQLVPLAEKIEKVTSTLGVIGLSQAANMTYSLAENLNNNAEKDQHLTEKKCLKIAEDLLKLQKVLDKYAETGEDITSEVFSENSSLNVKTIKQTQTAIIEELQSAQEVLVEFVESESAFFQLDAALLHLNHARGALILLSYADFIPLTDSVILYLHDDNKAKKRIPSEQEKHHLADIIAVLEASIKALQQNEDYTPILHSGYDAVQRLEELSLLPSLIEDEQLREVEQLLEQKKKKFQKVQPAILKKIKTL